MSDIISSKKNTPLSTFVPPPGQERRVAEWRKGFHNMGYDPDHNMLKLYLHTKEHDMQYLYFYEIVNFLPFIEGIRFNADKGLRKAYFEFMFDELNVLRKTAGGYGLHISIPEAVDTKHLSCFLNPISRRDAFTEVQKLMSRYNTESAKKVKQILRKLQKFEAFHDNQPAAKMNEIWRDFAFRKAVSPKQIEYDILKDKTISLKERYDIHRSFVAESKKNFRIVILGASGIGKTRYLDTLAEIKQKVLLDDPSYERCTLYFDTNYGLMNVVLDSIKLANVSTTKKRLDGVLVGADGGIICSKSSSNKKETNDTLDVAMKYAENYVEVAQNDNLALCILQAYIIGGTVLPGKSCVTEYGNVVSAVNSEYKANLFDPILYLLRKMTGNTDLRFI